MSMSLTLFPAIGLELFLVHESSLHLTEFHGFEEILQTRQHLEFPVIFPPAKKKKNKKDIKMGQLAPLIMTRGCNNSTLRDDDVDDVPRL